MKTKIKSASEVARQATISEPPRNTFTSVLTLTSLNLVYSGSVKVFKKRIKDKTLADMSDATFVARMMSSMKSDAAFDYAVKQQGQFNDHKHMLRCALSMRQTWNTTGKWKMMKDLIDRTWEFSTERVLNDASDRNAVIQLNRLRINLQINWTNDTVVTSKQIRPLRNATEGGFAVWSCLRHDNNGATAIMLRNLVENTYMIVYEDGTFKTSLGVYRLMADAWPTVARMERDTLASRKLAAKVMMKVGADGAVSINRKYKK